MQLHTILKPEIHTSTKHVMTCKQDTKTQDATYPDTYN